MTIRAKHIPVEQPKVPPCEAWVIGKYAGESVGWCYEVFWDKARMLAIAAAEAKKLQKVETWHLTNQVPDVEKAIDEVIEAHLAEHLSVDDLNLVDDAFRDFARRLGVIE